jgi:hypothetical protein
MDCFLEIAVSRKHFVDIELLLVFVTINGFLSGGFELSRSLQSGCLGLGGGILGMSLLSLVANYLWNLSIEVIEALVFLGFQLLYFIK